MNRSVGIVSGVRRRSSRPCIHEPVRRPHEFELADPSGLLSGHDRAGSEFRASWPRWQVLFACGFRILNRFLRGILRHLSLDAKTVPFKVQEQNGSLSLGQQPAFDYKLTNGRTVDLLVVQELIGIRPIDQVQLHGNFHERFFRTRFRDVENIGDLFDGQHVLAQSDRSQRHRRFLLNFYEPAKLFWADDSLFYEINAKLETHAVARQTVNGENLTPSMVSHFRFGD